MVSRHWVAEHGKLLCTCARGGKPRGLGRIPVERKDISNGGVQHRRATCYMNAHLGLCEACPAGEECSLHP